MKYKSAMLTILVRGSGDVASAAAHALFRAGHAAAIHEQPLPSATRRKMAFTDAVFEGSAWLEGLEARRVDVLDQLGPLLEQHAVLPVLVCSLGDLLESLRPQVLVDARMRKHSQPENQLALAPLTIGLGPNFIAGANVHLAVETGRGERLGQVITRGPTRPLEGEPVELGGHGRERYIYAPAAGLFHTRLEIGDTLEQDQVVALLDDSPLRAPLAGRLRGLTHDGVPVSAGTKVIEIDPRGSQAQVSGIGERPARIAQGVLEALAYYRG